MDKNGILIELSESDKTKVGKEDFAAQSTPQKVFSAVWGVESEVNNGGFSQYFRNTSCETAVFVVQALNIIGAPDTADLCKRALETAFPLGMPSSADAIASTAANFSDEVQEQLETLDSEFFTYPHSLTDLLFAFVSKHPEEFGKLPKADA